jgi:hypothetical protein
MLSLHLVDRHFITGFASQMVVSFCCHIPLAINAFENFCTIFTGEALHHLPPEVELCYATMLHTEGFSLE